MPVTVPRKPIIGAALAIMESRVTPFSSLATSRVPTFSMVVLMSLSGRPRRERPFSIIRAIGELLPLQSALAVKDLNSDFSYQITEIRHFEPAAVDQKLFDRVFGEGTVKDEKAFREKIAETIAPQLQQNSDYKFLLDVRAYLEKKVGDLQFPEALLRRVMLQNNQDKGADYVEKNFEGSIKELKWHLIKEQIVAANDIKVEDADLKAVAKEAIRAQFAQYGMSNVPDDVLENYAAEQLKKRENVENFVDRAIDMKLTDTLKNVVKLTQKEVTLADFNKLMQEK